MWQNRVGRCLRAPRHPSLHCTLIRGLVDICSRAFNLAEKIPSWLERLLLPRLTSLEGELKAFRGEVAGQFKEVAGEFKAVNGRIDSLEKQMSSLRNEMNARFDSLESKVTLVEDVTRLKMEVKILMEKVAAIAPS